MEERKEEWEEGRKKDIWKGRKEEKKIEKNTIESVAIDCNFWHREDETPLKIKLDN